MKRLLWKNCLLV